MSPDVPPNSSTTIARCAGPRWKSQLAIERLGLRDERRGPHQILPAGRGGGVLAAETHGERHEVLREHDAGDVVRRPVVHGEAGMFALAECLDDVVAGGRQIDRNHVEPGRHDLIDPGVGQREHAEQHVALGGAEVGLEGAPGGDEAVQALVDPHQQPEEQTERGEGAAREREGGRHELGCDTRQAARQGVAHNEQKGRRYRPASQRFRPGPAPPPQGVARGHRAEHE